MKSCSIFLNLFILGSVSSFQSFLKRPFYKRDFECKLGFPPTVDELPIYAAGSGGLFLLFKFGVYWRMQYLTASMVGGIPKNSRVVELNAADGKNIFYLPQGTDYTAVMSPGEDSSKTKEKMRTNEQLVLECVGKANRDGSNIKGKVRPRTLDIPSKSADCVLSVGAIAKSKEPVELIQEAFRILRPGGLLVFVEPDGENKMFSRLSAIFPEKIVGGTPAGLKAKVGVVENDSKKSKKSKGKKAKLANDLVLTTGLTPVPTADANTEFERRPDGDGSPISIGSDEVNSADNIEDSAGEIDEKTAVQAQAQDVRPGITLQRIQNILDPYVTGIAVRP